MPEQTDPLTRLAEARANQETAKPVEGPVIPAIVLPEGLVKDYEAVQAALAATRALNDQLKNDLENRPMYRNDALRVADLERAVDDQRKKIYEEQIVPALERLEAQTVHYTPEGWGFQALANAPAATVLACQGIVSRTPDDMLPAAALYAAGSGNLVLAVLLNMEAQSRPNLTAEVRDTVKAACRQVKTALPDAMALLRDAKRLRMEAGYARQGKEVPPVKALAAARASR